MKPDSPDELLARKKELLQKQKDQNLTMTEAQKDELRDQIKAIHKQWLEAGGKPKGGVVKREEE